MNTPSPTPSPTNDVVAQGKAYLASQGYTPPAPTTLGGDWYSNMDKQASAPSSAPATDNGTGMSNTTPVDWGKVLSDTLNTYKNAPETIENDLSQNTGKNPVVQVGENALNATSDTLNTIFAPFGAAAKGLTDAISSTIEKNPSILTNPIMGKVANFVQGASGEISKLSPETQKTLASALNIALLAGTGGAGEGEGVNAELPSATDVANGVKQAGSDIADTGKNAIDTAKEIPGKVKSAVVDKASQMAEDDWAKPTTKTSASYTKATDIYNNAADQGHNISKTLVDNGIKLSDNVDSGKYSTSDTADKIRTDAGKMSNEMLRPALEKADLTTEKTPVDEVINKVKEDIKNTKGETPGNIKAQMAQVSKEGEALMEKYPKGMGLTDMHDEKIGYAQNGGYKPNGTIADNNTSSMNRSFGRVLATQVEKKAPADVPVHDFNAELKKQYQSADYLDSLNTKTVPKSILSKITNVVAKGAGAATGGIAGGGILGEVAGYHVGGMVESMLENVPTQIRDSLLNNLEKTNPEAFTKINTYLKK